MRPLTVVLADDHHLVRAGIALLLRQVHDLDIVGEAADGHEALRLVREHLPRVAVLDIGLPGMNGLQVAEHVRRESPATRVVLLTMHSDEEYVLQALRVGVAGYLVKGASVSELEVAIRAVLRGETYLSPAVSHHVVRQLSRQGAPAENEGPSLTPRQREIVQLIAEGHSTKDIAVKLNLSPKTVESHRTEIMQRLGLHNVAGLVRYAVRTGLIRTDG